MRTVRPLSRSILPTLLLWPLCLLTVVAFAPGMPALGQDSGWVLALNQAVADRLVFGRDVLFTLGPFSSVYTGQYHPATDRLMLLGGTVVAAALAGGLCALSSGRRRWIALLAPFLVATVGQRDPAFILLPLLLAAIAARRDAKPAALLGLTAACALLNEVKGTFGTQALVLVGLTAMFLLMRRRLREAASVVFCYALSLTAFWLIARQPLAALPHDLLSTKIVISGYPEGLGRDGPASDIVAYLGASVLTAWLCWRDRGATRDAAGIALLGTALCFTLFVAFKSGFVRHDEHALIAGGTLAMVPLALTDRLRPTALATALLVNFAVLAFIGHHYPEYRWPSFERGGHRLSAEIAGAWSRLADPGRLDSLFASDLANLRAFNALPRVVGPTDIYSSGQTLLLANGLDWSPRPALQSVTVFSAPLEQADLDHLEGADAAGQAVQNVFYQVENEDDRLRSTEDGLSWPALLGQFRLAGYDPVLDIARLARRPGAIRTPSPGKTILDTRIAVGHWADLPASPTGLSWAVLDLRPTFAGRVAASLFRPPLLSITIRYADGRVQRARLVSALARGGFLLTPPIRDTADFVQLFLPGSRGPDLRPVAIRVDGQRGTRWLWQPAFALNLRTIDLPTTDDADGLLRPDAILELPPRTDARPAAALACAVDDVDGRPARPRNAFDVGTELRLNGWIVGSATGLSPDQVLVRLVSRDGQVWQGPARERYRADIAGYFVNPALGGSGFEARYDVSALRGTYELELLARVGTSEYRCTPQDTLRIGSPPIDPGKPGPSAAVSP